MRTYTPEPPTVTPTATPIPPTPTPALGIGSTLVSDKDGMKLVYVPAGNLLMGSTDAQVSQAQKEDAQCSSCFNEEKLQHTVYLDAYWIDQTDVTNALFAKFVAATGYQTDAEKAGSGYAFDPASDNWAYTKGANWQHPRGPNSDLQGLDQHPVVQVSWNDATAYCQWAGRRLPTEAEWEKAARGTDGRIYPWGNQPVAGNLLNFADKNLNVSWADKTIDDGYQYTSPVGHYPDGASPYGALDMAGNVWQWVNDRFSGTYYSSSPAKNPTGPTSGPNRGLRGGAWVNVIWSVRAAIRGGGPPDNRDDFGGFRCARSP